MGRNKRVQVAAIMMMYSYKDCVSCSEFLGIERDGYVLCIHDCDKNKTLITDVRGYKVLQEVTSIKIKSQNSSYQNYSTSIAMIQVDF